VTKEVDAYIAAAPKAAQPLLRQLRKTIKGAAPQAEETMSYKMPHYNHHGRLVYFAAFKDHVSLYPSGYAEKYKGLKKYMSGKGTLAFPLDEPLPVDLIAKFVRRRVKENEAAAAVKGGSRRAAARPSVSARSKS
jgi:uncharacterized protein YdhG (YjbR/CyaY superfamily)